MSKHFLFAAIASLAMVNSASASAINWQTPHNISGASDVNTTGTTFGTWAPASGFAIPTTVNGVDFYGVPDLSGFTTSFTTPAIVFGSPGTADANYNALLSNGTFSFSTSATVGWSGMTVGNTYLVELWVSDTRTGIGVESRTETFSGSGSDLSSSVAFQTAAGAGQYIVGTFVADATGAETITINGNVVPQLNLMQVRDLGAPPLPEPATLSLFGLGALAMLRRPLKKPA